MVRLGLLMVCGICVSIKATFISTVHLDQASQTQFTCRWTQSLGEAGPHQVFRKKGFDKYILILLNIFILF